MEWLVLDTFRKVTPVGIKPTVMGFVAKKQRSKEVKERWRVTADLLLTFSNTIVARLGPW